MPDRSLRTHTFLETESLQMLLVRMRSHGGRADPNRIRLGSICGGLLGRTDTEMGMDGPADTSIPGFRNVRLRACVVSDGGFVLLAR